MKKLLVIVMIICILMASNAIAETTNQYAQIPDEVLTILYNEVMAEMKNRGLLESDSESNNILRTKVEDIVLHEGKYIIGDDIPAGTYLITCTEADDSYQDYFSAMGGLAGLMDEETGNAYSSLFNALGMLAGEPTINITIIGPYGSTEKSYKLKKNENVKISLRENTAIEISAGSCTLAFQQ